MNAQRLVGILLVIQITILLAAAALFGRIPGISARSVMADSVQHFSLLAETMQPIDSTIRYDNTDAWLKTTQNSTVSSTSYIGQLDLPHGARIVGVRCFGLDSDPNGEFYFRLYRYNLWSDPVWSAVTDFAYSGVAFKGGKVMREATVDAHMATVDNAEFSYGLFLVLPKAQSGELGVLRCVVDTTYTVSLPLVRKN
jgi:hypothetical protein